MASALRHAARRFGTQAADQRLSSTALAAALRGLDPKKRDAAMRLLLIQQRKEELYELIDAWQSEYTSSGPLSVENTRLLNQLSGQAIAGECFKYAGGFFIAKTAGDGLVDLYREVQQPTGK